MLDLVVAAVEELVIVASPGPASSSEVLPSAAVVFVAAAVFEPAPFASGKVWGPGFARPVLVRLVPCPPELGLV